MRSVVALLLSVFLLAACPPKKTQDPGAEPAPPDDPAARTELGGGEPKAEPGGEEKPAPGTD